MTAYTYWMILHLDTSEMIAVIKSEMRVGPYKDSFKERFARNDEEGEAINKEFDRDWYFCHKSITRAEFETYQAFGIKEIKLP